MQVIEKAREVWKEDASRCTLIERVDFVGGDFFKHGRRLLRSSIPEAGPLASVTIHDTPHHPQQQKTA